nr:hypothetical protein BaRGS_027377 [Batillaria attramentaria]
MKFIRIKFKECIDPIECGLTDILRQENAISTDEEEEVKKKLTRRDKAWAAWDILCRLSPRLFDKVCMPFLKENFPHVFGALQALLLISKAKFERLLEKTNKALVDAATAKTYIRQIEGAAYRWIMLNGGTVEEQTLKNKIRAVSRSQDDIAILAALEDQTQCILKTFQAIFLSTENTMAETKYIRQGRETFNFKVPDFPYRALLERHHKLFNDLNEITGSKNQFHNATDATSGEFTLHKFASIMFQNDSSFARFGKRKVNECYTEQTGALAENDTGPAEHNTHPVEHDTLPTQQVESGTRPVEHDTPSIQRVENDTHPVEQVENDIRPSPAQEAENDTPTVAQAENDTRLVEQVEKDTCPVQQLETGSRPKLKEGIAGQNNVGCGNPLVFLVDEKMQGIGTVNQ